MNYEIIGTGSKGNALLLENKILIDCGVSFKKIREKDFQVVMITHEHSDHFNAVTIRQIAENRPLVRWVCPSYLVQKLVARNVMMKNIDIVSSDQILNYGTFKVSIVDLIHDVPNCGYVVEINQEKALYMTDTGTADHVIAKDFDYYFIEANYREAELKETISQKLAAGAFSYETRVADTHLSEEQAIRFISENARPESKVIYMHKHIEKEDEINDNYTYRETVSASE